MGCCHSSRNRAGSAYKSLLTGGKLTKSSNYITRGNEENAEMLITFLLREFEGSLDIHIPKCINYICLKYYYEATNVIFKDYDHCNSWNVTITDHGKKMKISSNTIFVFSDIGYSSGYHCWSVKLLNIYNCQALGITEFANPTYRYGYNIFDSDLNEQLGDRYIYAGDINHGWRGSTENRPYIMNAENNKLKYNKKLKLKNNRWEKDDIITIELNMQTRDNKPWTIAFLKNGKYLCDPIKIKNKKTYYPVFQCYQRGNFEIIDDYAFESCY